MSSDGLIQWFDNNGGSFNWKNSDLDTIKDNLRDIQDKKGKRDRDKQVNAAINSSKKSIAKVFQDDSSKLTEWVERENDKYVQDIQKRFDSAKSSQSLRQIYSRYRDREYEDDKSVEDLFNERLKIFDVEQEKAVRSARADIKSRAKEFDSVDNFRDLERLEDELYDMAEKNDLTSEVRSLYGRDFDRRRDELLKKEEWDY